jgi:replication fork protection complex subunit Tof1/Swi1
MFVHDSDDEDWDAEKDAAFFAREQAIREENLKMFKKSLVLGSIEPVAASKKRKADAPAKKGKRRKSPPKRNVPFEDSDDDMEDENSRAPSEAAGNILDDAESEDEATDTPLSSQNAGAAAVSDADTPSKFADLTAKSDVTMADADTDDDDDVPVTRRPAARNIRAGFVIDSDSDE